MNKLIVNANRKKDTIHRNIYGHFSEHLGRCIYGGLYAGQNSAIPNHKGMRTDVVNALRHIRVPVLRWPGGCFADEYHWKDGIGPVSERKKMINTHWGGLVEDNSFGTHEFMELCDQIGCQPYINGNVGSGTVQEMSEWVEYITFDGLSPMSALREKNGRKDPWSLTYFGVGNETWGCGGNMRPEYYADLYRQFQTYVRNYGDNKIYKIASGANDRDYRWTKVLMELAGHQMDALTFHYYTHPTGSFEDRGSATRFSEEEYYSTLKKALYMNDLLENHSRIMDYYDPDRRVGLIVDEWGTWFNVEEGTNPGFLYQQNTMRDAMVAALTLNIFNRHCGRVVMANLAQTVNVLQALILTEGEKMILTPTYHVFDLYKGHMDATLLDSYVECAEVGAGGAKIPQLDVTASQAPSGVTHITLTNVSPKESRDIACTLAGIAGRQCACRILSGQMDDKNDFDCPDHVAAKPFTDITPTADGFTLTIPACSVIEISVS